MMTLRPFYIDDAPTILSWCSIHFFRNSVYFPFLNSLGFMPFILLKKRAKVVTSAKWRRSEIWVMLSEVWRSRNTASIRSIWLM